MANFQTAPKLRIVNSPGQFVISRKAKKANGAYEPITLADPADPVADAAATDLFQILGFADLHKGAVKKAVITSGIPGQKQTSTLTVTLGTVVAGKEFTIRLRTKTNNLEHEFVRFDGKNMKDRYYNYILKTGDTAATVAARIAELIQYDDFSDAYKFVDATAASNVVTLVGESEGWSFDFLFEGEAITDGNVTIAHAITAKQYEGRNVYRQLNVKRLETPNRIYPYAAGHYVAKNELPVPDALYSNIIIEWDVERTDLSGASTINQGPVTSTAAIELFLKNGDLDAEKALLVQWLKSNASRVEEYNATTANAAIASETPVVTTN